MKAVITKIGLKLGLLSLGDILVVVFNFHRRSLDNQVMNGLNNANDLISRCRRQFCRTFLQLFFFYK
ncbi:CLUMA_CG019261, isoform A [Clunio marinus]|uniref:CLUMA_CG019261, isoform A n=1 Tax=Clunio marinus TaxID=568069 RepID=A0A1J1J1A5_9DIPT|nr:CLUMA_CG019261, isoform A [Clunio marinus]